MESTPLSYKEIMQLIQELNAFADDIDSAILRTQQQNAERNAALVSRHAKDTSQFNADSEAAIAAVRGKAQRLVADAKSILAEIQALDAKLSSVDKYFVKTKTRKRQELSGKRSDQYQSGGDYFETLSQIKSAYTALSRKYSDDILPGLINGLNYLFSAKRKHDYEELIILENTVEGFVAEIADTMPELTAETIEGMRATHERQRAEMERTHKAVMERQEKAYAQSLQDIAASLDRRFNDILPEALVDYLAYWVKVFIGTLGKVNTASLVANNIMAQGFIEYPIAGFVQSQVLSRFIKHKLKKLVQNDSVLFPVLASTTAPLPLYVKKEGDNAARMHNLIHGMMFSYLSSVFVGKLRLHVIDIKDTNNHGENVQAFYTARFAMPELFGGRIHDAAETAIPAIIALNNKIESVTQNLLGTRYASIFEYARDNPQADVCVDLLTIFELPAGLGEPALSKLKNIITHGPRCGIFVLIAESDNVSVYRGKGYVDCLSDIQRECAVLQQTGEEFFVMGLRFCYHPMPDKAAFDAFFSKYMLLNEGIRNGGIAFPPLLKGLTDCKDEASLNGCIAQIRGVADAYDSAYGHAPPADVSFPEQIVLGYARYPGHVFEDSYGYEKIRESFAHGDGRIDLPLLYDLHRSSHIFITYAENDNTGAVTLPHNIIWSFLSAIPVTKLNICVLDPDKKGGSVMPFLDLRKRCPDVFDDRIYTNAEDIHERLSKLNRHIDSLIQDTLGNRFDDLIAYNQSAPKSAQAVTLLVIYDFPGAFDARSMDLLLHILKNGARCGVYVALCHNQDIRYDSYDSFSERLGQCMRYCTSISYADKAFILNPFQLPLAPKPALAASEIDRFISDYALLAEKAKTRGLSFDDILDGALFSRALSDGLSIPVGVGDAEAVIPLVFGVGSSHHALVAGATGSGKSTLLHTIIMSAMLHYTPDLLNLYLMDFKSGTEFKVYDTIRLPHIKLLALDAMQEFGESILENLVSEMESRSGRFKQVGASKLGEYVQLSGLPMPKILVIMDEFQVLFNDSTNRKVAYHCAELAKRIVTEGRSFGIHLLMATQSTKIITDLTLSTGTVEQMRIRIGLKCGEYDAHYLFAERNDAEALEMMKGPIGTAVLNQEYTEEANIGLRVAYCDDASQAKYLDIIAQRFTGSAYDLQTFEGGRTTPLLSVIGGGFGLDTSPTLTCEVGTLIKVAPPLRVTFDRRRKHNTLICGSNDAMAENLANLYTLAILRNAHSLLYCFDGECLLGPSPSDAYYAAFARFGERFVLARDRGDIIRGVNAVYEAYAERKKKNSDRQLYVLIKNLQFLDIVKSMLKGDMIDESDYIDNPGGDDKADAGDTFDFGLDIGGASPNVSEKLAKLLDDGAAYGIHFIVTSLEYQSVKDTMYYGENALNKFPERYVFSLNNNDSDSLIENVSVSSLRDNTVYYSDSVKNTFQVKPYVFPKADELHAWMTTLLEDGDGRCPT